MTRGCYYHNKTVYASEILEYNVEIVGIFFILFLCIVKSCTERHFLSFTQMLEQFYIL